MNKIFKVVWSQVKGCFVVINEFGKTHQSKSKHIAKKGMYRGVLGACILGIISSSPVFAVTGNNGAIKFQEGAGTVIGAATAQGNSNTVAVGTESVAKGGSSVAIGGGKTNGEGAPDGDQGTGQGQVAIGWSKAVDGTGVVAIGNSAASGRGAVALGNKSSASEEGSVAIGNHSTALGTNSVAIGGGSANGVGAISIGADSSSTYNGAITLGRNSEATNQDAIALGAGSAVGSVGGFAVSGGYVGTSDYYGIAIGAGASVDGGHNNIGGGIALGKDAKVTAEGSVALGYGSEAGAANQNETAKSWEITIGNEKTTYSFAGYYKQQQYVIGNGVVSVGAKGAERMITNVAAGNLSPESTDVVNGSQLYAVTDAVKKIGKVAGAKTTLTETSDGAITVSKSTEDGHDNYDITLNADKVAEATNLSYKASGDTASKTVSLSKGLTFAAGTNLTATSGEDGVITYDLKKTLTGITSISNGSNGATITLSDDAVTLNNKPLKGVATGTDATDAVNKRQLESAIETITGNNGALSNTITLTGDGASSTTGQALNKQGGISFAITGSGDITTTADGSSVKLTLNKATSVAKGETKVVTSGAVYSAVEGAKTAITPTDDASILTVNKAEGTGIAKDTYTLGINTSALNTEVAKNYYNKTEVDTKVTGAKTTLTETSGGAITVSKKTEKDGHDNYDITFNADKVAEATNLSYKASGDAASKTVSLSKGLTFAAGTNLTATSGEDGVITYDLKKTLTGITSISNGSNGATITLSDDAVTLNNKPLKGVATGTDATDAVNKRQLESAIETITGNNGALSNTITLTGDGASSTTGQALNKQGGISFAITGSGDITTTADGSSVKLTLNKATSVAKGETKVVTSGAVYSAVEGAKTAITPTDDASILTVNKAEGTGIAKDTYTLGINTSALNTEVAKNYYNKTEVDTKVTGAKTTLTETSGGAITVSKKTEKDGHDNYDITLNADKVAEATNLSYKAGEDTASKTVSLSKGLTFAAGTNLTATSGEDGVITYDLKKTLTGITSISNGSNGATITLSDDAVTLNNKPLKGVANGTDATDAVNKRQLDSAIETITGNDGALSNTITLTGDGASSTTGQALNKQGGISFAITGSGDITTTADGSSVNLTLNKATSVAKGETKVVTSGAVYSAVEGAKTAITPTDDASILTVNKAEGTGIAKDTYTLGINTSALNTEVAKNYYNKTQVDTKVTGAKTTLTETSGGAITVSKKTENDGHDNYDITFNADKVAEATNLSYKASGDAASKTVSLSKGLTFAAGTNLTATSGADGVITYDLKKTLTGITSISNGSNGATITLSDDAVTLNNKPLKGVATGTDATDAVNKRQLESAIETITGNNGALSNTITLTGDGASSTTGQALNKQGGISFAITGSGDITTTADGSSVNLTLNKATSVAKGETKVVTSGAVYSAVEGAKTAITPTDDASILTVNKAEGTGIAKDTYTLGINTSALNTEVAKNYYNKTEVDTKVTGAKTTLTETSGGAITVSKKTEKDGHDNYDITFNADKVAEATNLSYKASGDAASKTVSLSKGLTFAAGTNLTATSGEDGVITYDLKKTLTGITSISNGSNGATITLSDDAVTLNNKPLKGVATGTDATDAVNKRQLESAIETITGNNGALSNTITLTGDGASSTTGQALNKQGGISFAITGSGDITTTADGSSVNLTLNKATSVAKGETKVVTSGAVYSAVEGAKTAITPTDDASILTVNKAEGTGIAKDTYTLGINTSALNTEVAKNYYNKTQVDTKVTGAKTTLTETSGGAITVSKKTENDGHDNYDITFNADKVAEATNLSYKAGEDTASKTVSLSKGLTFAAGTNLTATSGEDGVITYDLKKTLTGITSISNGSNGATITLSDDAVTLNNKPLKGVANGTDATDAVNKRQLDSAIETITGNDGALSNTITLTGDGASSTTGQALNKQGGISFAITGSGDITTTADGSSVNLTLNKATSVAKGETKVVTSGAVYSAVEGAKTAITPTDDASILTVNKAEGTGIAKDTYTLGINTSALNTEVAKNYYNKTQVDTKVTGAKTTLTETSGGAITVSKKTENDGHDNYDITFNADKVAEATNLSYKASGDAASKTVSLSKGLTFAAGTNLTATSGADGVITYDLKKTLTGITSISNGSNGATITLSDDAVTLNNKPLKGVATGTDATDAVNKRQLESAIETITGNNGALSNTITLTGDGASSTTGQALNKQGGISFAITGSGDITTTADGSSVNLTLNKATSVAKGETKVVTSGAVYSAVEGAKTAITPTDDASILTVNKAEGAGIAKDTYTLGINASALNTEVAKNYYNKTEVDTKVTGAKTTLTETSGGAITVSKKTEKDGHDNYDITLNADKVAEATNLSYKAGEDTASKTVSLSKGLTFAAGTNLTATSGEDGVITYDLKKTLTGITSISNGSNGATITLSDDAVTLNNKPLKGVANGTDATDAVNKRQLDSAIETITGNDGALSNTITLTGDGASSTTGQALNKQGGISFAITGSGDITTTADGSSVNLTLNKATSVAKGETKVVTSGAVYSAVEGAKTAITPTDDASILTVNKAEGTGIAKDTYTLGINTSALNTEVAKNYYNKTQVDTKVTGAKTTLTETSGGAITVSKKTENDGHDNYDITFNADKVAEATNLSYKASGDAASKTVSLSKGLTFAAGTNLTATSGADGVITYDLKKTLTGITSISNGSNGATITLSDDAVTLNNKPLKGVATGTDATDAVNKRQLESAIETITGNNGALSNTITLTGDGASSTTGQALNKQGGISFAITGSGDITTTADGSSVNLTLNKATSVAKGETKVVTSGAVYSAVEGAKTAITPTDDASILTVNKAEGAGIAKDTYTLGINASALNTEVAKNYYNKTEVDTKVTGAKTTLTETSDGAITVSKKTENDGHDNYDITFNADKVAEATNLSYKASGDAASKTVSLSKGLTFAAGTNLTATSGADGVITYDLNKTLTGITSISNGSNGATITLSDDAVTLNNKPLKGVANGTDATDAVNKRQLDSAIETITGNDGALSNTITLTGDGASSTTGQALNKQGGISFAITGSGDITTTADGSSVKLTLNKATSVAKGETKVVTSGAVYSAVEGAKTAITPTDDASILTVNKAEGTGIAKDTYTLGINTSALNTEVAKNYYNKTEVDTKVTGAKTTLTETSGGAITVSKKTEKDGHDNYDITLNADKVAEATNLSYKAGEDTASKTVSLSKGLTFAAGTNLTATSGEDGVITYDLKKTLTGITSISNGSNGATITLSDDAVTLNNKPLKGVANGTDATDAVNKRQLDSAIETITGNDGALSNTITLTGDGASSTTGQALNKQGGISFAITGSGDITTTADGSSVNLTLNKATSVAKGETKVVTSGAVYSAVEGAKTAITPTDDASILTVNKAEGTGIAKDTYTLGINTSALNTEVAKNYYNKTQVDTKVTGAKTTLTETSGGAITVSKKTENDGHDNYDITFNADKVAEATNLSYKASGDAASKTVSLSKGLTFAAGTNLTATSGADGVITYDLKKTLTGITSISNGSNGATITLSDDAVTLNNKPLKGVATGTDATDAVNKRQLESAIETITGNNGALSNTITLTGDGASSTTGQALNKQGGISFAITGSGDITTTADGSSVNLTLNKATSVAKGETKVVTSGAVYSAVEGAKTAITPTDDASILTVNKAEGAGIAKDTYTLGINASALNTEVAKNYYNKTEVDTKVTGAKTTLTETSDGAITVSKKTENDGHDNYDITFNADKVAEATNLSYKASGDAASKTVSLSKGLTFAAGTNLTATSGADGVITYDLNKTLTGITSISNGSNGATITLSDDAVTLNNKPLKGVANGTDATDAVNKRQLDSAIETITGNDGALSNTITLGGNNGSFTSNQTLNQKDGIKLIIKGVDESSNENGKIVAPEWADFDTNNVMTKADGDTLRIAISKMPTFKTVNTDMIIAKEGNFSDKIVIGNITIQNKGGQLTWDGNNTLFYVEDKDGNKRAIGLNDSVRFNEYLKVVDDEKNISGNGGTGSDNSGVNGSSGALDKNTTPTVNVDVDKLINEKDLANKTYINNKLSELKTTIISEVSPNGTIGTGTNTDMKAVSGQTVEEYLEKNYTNNRELNRYLTELSHQANAGTASALASAGMPQISSLENGNIMISAGVGSYGGESAVALGISGINNNRDITYKVATTYDSTGRWGLSGGIGFAIGAGSNRSLNNVNSKELANRLNSLEKANKSLSETNSKLQEEVENLKAMLQQLLQK